MHALMTTMPRTVSVGKVAERRYGFSQPINGADLRSCCDLQRGFSHSHIEGPPAIAAPAAADDEGKGKEAACCSTQLSCFKFVPPEIEQRDAAEYYIDGVSV